jgi:hypothetical protein
VRNLNNRQPFEGLDCEVVYADLLDKESLLKAFTGVETLYQVAGAPLAGAHLRGTPRLSGVGFLIGQMICNHAAEGFFVGQVELVNQMIQRPRFVV